MTAALTLRFDDGTEKVIELEKAIELDLGPRAKKSLEFRETSKGSWIMTFTSTLMEGRKLAKDFLSVSKNGSVA